MKASEKGTTLRDPRPVGNGEPKAARLSVEILTREARKVMADLEIDVSPNRLVKILNRYVREGRADVDFRTWFIAYADPTGETAVGNVMAARRASAR